MKLRLRPYHLYLLLVGSASLLVLWRINKMNFYHHYFKVIEEVELRNSQAVESFPQISLFSLTQAQSRPLAFWLTLLGWVGTLVTLFSLAPLPRRARVLSLAYTRQAQFSPQAPRAP